MDLKGIATQMTPLYNALVPGVVCGKQSHKNFNSHNAFRPEQMSNMVALTHGTTKPARRRACEVDLSVDINRRTMSGRLQDELRVRKGHIFHIFFLFI